MRYEFLGRKVMKKGEYEDAVAIIKDAIENETNKDVSFLVYGSFLDSRLMPGISDIDCVLFFWHDFVLPTDSIIRLSEALREGFSHVRFDLGWFLDASIIDAGNARDGRFIPYNDNFSKIFDPVDGDSKLICGKFFVKEMSPVTLVDPVEARIAFNLQALRTYLIFGRCNQKFINGVNPYRELKIFSQVRSLGRKVMQLIEPDNMEVLKDKKKAFCALKKNCPNIDCGALDEIEKMFQDRNEVIDIIMSTETRDILAGALTCYEQVVRHIVQNFPSRSVKERSRQ